MSDVRFSIVIPTRERAHTLYYTLKTCLAQKFESFEIVVSDNCSSLETKQVVDSFGSDKIKYVRSNVPLAMSDNWELALSHTSGEFVTVIGDDDGMMPSALVRINDLIEKFKITILRWDCAEYHWPDVQIPEIANRLYLPLPKEIKLVQSRRAIMDVANGKAHYHSLPMIYRSVIRRDLINELKRKTGRVFKSRIPDVYSGYAFAYLSKGYYSTDAPMTMHGFSGKSNGIGSVFLPKGSSVFQEFRELNKTAGFFAHIGAPDISFLIPAIIGNEFLWAKDFLFSNDRRLYLNRKDLIKRCLDAMEHYELDIQADIFARVREATKDDPKLAKWFQENYRLGDYKFVPRDWHWEPGYFGGFIYFNMADLGIANISDVSEFCGKILGNYALAEKSLGTSIRKIGQKLLSVIQNRSL